MDCEHRAVPARGPARSGLTAIELAENIAGNERACHLELAPGTDARSVRAALARDRFGTGDRQLCEFDEADPASTLRLRRNVRAFFQGNRFLLEPLVRHVAALVPQGPVVDLYAGVGLFGLSLAAAGIADVTLVEGDPVSGADLHANAEPFGDRVRVERRSVEAFLRSRSPASPCARVIVDPPRTGMSKDALAGLVRAGPAGSFTCRATWRRSRAIRGRCSTRATRWTVSPESTCSRTRRTWRRRGLC